MTYVFDYLTSHFFDKFLHHEFFFLNHFSLQFKEKNGTAVEILDKEFDSISLRL